MRGSAPARRVGVVYNTLVVRGSAPARRVGWCLGGGGKLIGVWVVADISLVNSGVNE